MASLSVSNLCVEYPLASRRRRRLLPGRYRELDRIRSAKVLHALVDVSFELHSGDRLAVIGPNGSGKSTLLMALAGIYYPAKGHVRAEGRVDALFNTRIGFHEEATGRRNIVLRGLVSGFSRSQIDAKIDEIIEFSELGDHINLPLYTYSQGMGARLAFACATAFDPDILLMDEWIGAGDRAFQKKASARMRQFVASAGIVVLASHNENILRSTCNLGCVLEHGHTRFFGPIDEALADYSRA